MKIKRLILDHFMLFHSLNFKPSAGVNIICGDNSTGKTIILKTLYATLQSYSKLPSNASKEEIELLFAKKLQGVFRPDHDSVGRLVSRRRGSGRASIQVDLDNNNKQIAIGFGNHSSKRVSVNLLGLNNGEQKRTQPVYLPPKEIISATENFSSLYEDFHIAFEETYNDLAKLLDRPLKKGPNTAEQNQVLEKFERIMSGTVSQKDKKFFLNVQGKGTFEMGLVSEGYRKLATIMYLISSGSLNKNAILFWDEPEANMNPCMIQPIVEAVLALAQMGVQVFISTHDYFIQQVFNLAATYPAANPAKVDIQFVSLYRDEDEQISISCAPTVAELERNFIMEEFDALYDRELCILDGN